MQFMHASYIIRIVRFAVVFFVSIITGAGTGGLKMRRLFTILLAFSLGFCVLSASADPSRGVATFVEGLDPNLKVGRQHLVVIGINRYRNWLPLNSPVEDVQEIRDILQSRYYIDEVHELYDEEATKANIIKLLVRLQRKVKPDDSVLILYSGHGHLDEHSDTGFWIPANAGTDVYEQHNWLPHTQLKGLIANIEANHVCVISDSCFAGDLIHATRSIPPVIDAEYFKRSYSRVSRQVLTSGATEIVPDESEFADQLKTALQRNQNRFLDALLLYNEIRLGVESSIPLLGTLSGTGHQEGASFVLFLKEEAQAEPTPFGPIHLDPGPSVPALAAEDKPFLTTGVAAGYLYPVADMSNPMSGGWDLRMQLHINRDARWGTVGFGLSTGWARFSTDHHIAGGYAADTIPLALSMRIEKEIALPLFWSLEMRGGAMISLIRYLDGSGDGYTTSKSFLSPTLDLGWHLFQKWDLSLYAGYLLILFDNNAFSGVSAGARIQCSFPRKRKRP